jgi:Flp pilus assembly protein TadD
LAIVWLLAELLQNIDRKVLAGLTAVVLLGFTGLSFRQASFWQNGETLYMQTLSVTENNAVIEQNLCQHLINEDRLASAEEQCNNAILHRPNFSNAYMSLGIINLKNKKYGDAEKNFGKVLELNPNDFAANSNLTKFRKNGN